MYSPMPILLWCPMGRTSAYAEKAARRESPEMVSRAAILATRSTSVMSSMLSTGRLPTA
jgi:hypothetical protein